MYFSRRIFFALIIIKISLLPVCGLAEEQTYRIAVLLPLTGRAATIGVPIRHSVELALASMPKAEAGKIEVVFEDDEGSAQKAVSAYQQLANRGGADALIVFGSGIGNPLAPLAQKDGKIMIALVASDENVWRNRPLVFSHWMPIAAEAERMVQEIKARSYRRLAMITHEQEGVNAFDEIFSAALRQAGLQDIVVLREKCLTDTSDFKPLVLRAKAKSADSIYAVFVTGAAVFAKQARELGLRSDIIGIHSMNNDAERKAADGALSGTWFVTAEEPEQFRQRFHEKFGYYPAIGSVNGYDSLMLLANGAAHFGKNNEKIAEYLRTLKDYHGAAGTYSSTGEGRFTIPVVVKTVTKDGFETNNR